MVDAIVTWLGAVGSGGEASPLSPSSQLSELLRVVQFAIAAGIWYLINQMRKTRNHNEEAHGEVQADINKLRMEVSKLTDDIKPLIEIAAKKL